MWLDVGKSPGQWVNFRFRIYTILGETEGRPWTENERLGQGMRCSLFVTWGAVVGTQAKWKKHKALRRIFKKATGTNPYSRDLTHRRWTELREKKKGGNPRRVIDNTSVHGTRTPHHPHHPHHPYHPHHPHHPPCHRFSRHPRHLRHANNCNNETTKAKASTSVMQRNSNRQADYKDFFGAVANEASGSLIDGRRFFDLWAKPQSIMRDGTRRDRNLMPINQAQEFLGVTSNFGMTCVLSRLENESSCWSVFAVESIQTGNPSFERKWKARRPCAAPHMLHDERHCFVDFGLVERQNILCIQNKVTQGEKSCLSHRRQMGFHVSSKITARWLHTEQWLLPFTLVRRKNLGCLVFFGHDRSRKVVVHLAFDHGYNKRMAMYLSDEAGMN